MAKRKAARKAPRKKTEDTSQIAKRVLDTATGQGTKADAIRNEIAKQGSTARPTDIIKALAANGVTASSSQVSTLLTAGKKRKKIKGTSNGQAVSMEALFAAKGFVTRCGNMEAAKVALAGLASLLN